MLGAYSIPDSFVYSQHIYFSKPMRLLGHTSLLQDENDKKGKIKCTDLRNRQFVRMKITLLFTALERNR